MQIGAGTQAVKNLEVLDPVLAGSDTNYALLICFFYVPFLTTVVCTFIHALHCYFLFALVFQHVEYCSAYFFSCNFTEYSLVIQCRNFFYSLY